MRTAFEIVHKELASFFALEGHTRSPFARYQLDPVAYSRDVLHVDWWAKQTQVAEALLEHSRVFVKASHNVGKTFLSGGLVNWHFDAFPRSITKSTAPTKHQVQNLTWKEVRRQRGGRDMLPKAPRIESYLPNGDHDPGHYAAGYTARDAHSFQGDHEEDLFLLFEEAVGIDEQFWTAAEGMLSSGPRNRWLALLNPTDTSSEAYQQELSGDWHVITISALEHPNVAAELRGLARPYPKAIALSWVEERVKKWCTPVEPGHQKASDFAWPPIDYCEEKGITPTYYRPGPKFEGMVLGRWPSQAIDSVWSEAMWIAAVAGSEALRDESLSQPIEIGCDRARFGDDDTSMHARRGPVSIHHESHNGWDTARTLAALKDLAGKMGRLCGVEAKKVLVKVDDFQGGVVDAARADGWNFVEISAASTAVDEEGYPNRRSELWFAVADRAYGGRLDLSLLPKEAIAEIRRQAMAPKWKPDSRGRRVVEPKEQTKKRIKRSPDDMDALNLAYAPPPPEPDLEVFFA